MKKLLVDGCVDKNSIQSMSFCLLNAVKKIASAYDITSYSSQNVDFDNVQFSLRKITLPLANNLWRSLILPLFAYLNKEIPFFFPNAMVPNFIPASTPVVTMITDILPHSGVSSKEEKAYRRKIQASIYSSDLVFVPTEQHKKKLCEEYVVSNEPIVVGFASVIDEKYLDLPLTRNPEKYFYIQIEDGNSDGLNELLKIFIYAHTVGRNKPKLYIVGDLGKVSPELSINIDVAEKLGAIRGYNNLSNAQRAALIRGAIATLLPSANTTLPLVHLDAMKCACPVVTVDIPPVREICDDAVIYSDVRITEDYKNLLDRLEYDNEFRKEIIYKAIYREKMYSWEKVAQIFVENLESC